MENRINRPSLVCWGNRYQFPIMFIDVKFTSENWVWCRDLAINVLSFCHENLICIYRSANEIWRNLQDSTSHKCNWANSLQYVRPSPIVSDQVNASVSHAVMPMMKIVCIEQIDFLNKWNRRNFFLILHLLQRNNRYAVKQPWTLDGSCWPMTISNNRKKKSISFTNKL